MRGDGRPYDDGYGVGGAGRWQRLAWTRFGRRPASVSVVPPAVTEQVAEVAARAGMTPPAIVVRRTRSVAHASGGRRGGVVVLDPSVLAAGPVVGRAVVAHELAHLVADHGGDVRARLWGMVFGAVAVGAGVLVGTGRLVPAAVAVLLFTALATLLVLRRLRGHEYAADRAAAALLGESGSTLAALAWLAAAHPRPAVRRGFGWTVLLADHPTRADRVAALRGAAGKP